jgi:hypothetical protein
MAHPILDEAEFSTGVEEMRGNGMFEVMERALLWRQARLLARGLHGTPQRAAINGHAAVRDEEIR